MSVGDLEEEGEDDDEEEEIMLVGLVGREGGRRKLSIGEEQ